mgnify:FL=1|tara:strand:+ start:234 stop:419 length:186 start_codon:yes stop_codon:yes gene_type:complete
MPFTNDELIELSEDVWELINDIQAVKAENSAEGKKITKKEARRLLKSILKIAAKIAVDVID